MKALILVEGQTEETFVRDALGPYFEEKGIFMIPTILVTKRVKSGKSFRGGLLAYSKVKGDIIKLLNDASAALVTTMFDFYALPDDFPRKQELKTGHPIERVRFLENAFEQDIGHAKFLAYFSMHEFEALLFTNPEKIQRVFPRNKIQPQLERIKLEFGSPEEIDDSPQTAPSKRIVGLCPEYRKALHGPQVAKDIGIEHIREQCKHFDQWLDAIERRAKLNNVK